MLIIDSRSQTNPVIIAIDAYNLNT